MTAKPSDLPSTKETQRKIGRRILKAGQTVKITGLRGTFRIQHFAGKNVAVYGGTPGREMHRTFPVDRIGPRPRQPGMRINPR